MGIDLAGPAQTPAQHCRPFVLESDARINGKTRVWSPPVARSRGPFGKSQLPAFAWAEGTH